MKPNSTQGYLPIQKRKQRTAPARKLTTPAPARKLTQYQRTYAQTTAYIAPKSSDLNDTKSQSIQRVPNTNSTSLKQIVEKFLTQNTRIIELLTKLLLKFL